MTKKKDLKALVRARMAKTGESYTTAKNAVEAQHKPTTGELEAILNGPPVPITMPPEKKSIEIFDDEAVSKAGAAQRAEVLRKMAEDPQAFFEANKGGFSFTPDREQLVAEARRNMAPLSDLDQVPQAAAYLDSDTFALVKLELLPCGHKLRRNTEIPQDLRALYGAVGVEAFNNIIEGERQKHRTGRCEETIKDLRLVPRYDIDKHHMTMVLIDDKGQLLYPKAGNFVVPPEDPTSVTSVSEVTITLNGTRVLAGPTETYESLVRLAGLPPGPFYTITYRRGQFQGTLTPNSKMTLFEDLILNVVGTNNA